MACRFQFSSRSCGYVAGSVVVSKEMAVTRTIHRARVIYPPYSRQQLTWSIFEECARNEWRLVLPNYYAWLYFTRHTSLRSKCHTGWRDTQSGRRQFAFFNDLSAQDVLRTQNFITAYRQPVIIGLNDHIRPHFSHELDACMCLDFNKAESAPGEFVRTTTGELEYLAKYQQSMPAMDSLLNRLMRGVNLMPIANMVKPVVPFALTYIPPEPTKQFHLPREMAHRLARRLATVEQARRWLPCVDATLTGPKSSLKSATLEQKFTEWQRLVSSEAIQISAPVDGLAVIILDDLYQSGVTMWTYAKYLKSLGARWVFGLTCVKSLRDTDNV